MTAPLPEVAELPIGACANAMELVALIAVARTITFSLMRHSFR
jgi:hypothetical protein